MTFPSLGISINLADIAAGAGQIFMDMWPIVAFSVGIIIGFGVLFGTKGLATRKGAKHKVQ